MLRSKNINTILIILLISLINVLLLVKLQLSYANIVILFLATMAVVIKPETLLILFLIGTSTVTKIRFFPEISIAHVDIYFTDFLLILSFIILLLKYDVRHNLDRLKNPMTFMIIIYIIFIIIAILKAVVDIGFEELTPAISSARSFIYYLFFIPVLALINDEKKLMWFVKVLIVLCILVSLYMAYTGFFGRSIIHEWIKGSLSRRSMVSVNTGLEGTVLEGGRIRDIPGILYVVIILPMILGLLVYNWKSKSLKYYYIGVFLGIIPIVLSFTRMIWVSFVVMIVVMLFLVRGKGIRYVKITLTTASFIIAVLVILSFVPKYSHVGFASFVSKRFMSFFTENIKTPTAIQRIIESKVALEKIEDNYLWGIGITQELESTKVIYNNRVYYVGSIGSLHNSYLNIIFKIGLFPFIIYMIMSFLFLKRTYSLFKRSKRSYVKGLSIGLFLSYFRIMLNAVSQHLFSKIYATPVIAVLFALNEILILLDREKPEIEPKSRSVVKRESAIVTTFR